MRKEWTIFTRSWDLFFIQSMLTVAKLYHFRMIFDNYYFWLTCSPGCLWQEIACTPFLSTGVNWKLVESPDKRNKPYFDRWQYNFIDLNINRWRDNVLKLLEQRNEAVVRSDALQEVTLSVSLRAKMLVYPCHSSGFLQSDKYGVSTRGVKQTDMGQANSDKTHWNQFSEEKTLLTVKRNHPRFPLSGRGMMTSQNT